MIRPWDDEAKTCLSCLYGRYHAAQSGALESPPQEAYCACVHPRICREAVVYDPSVAPYKYQCRYWALRADGADAAGMDAEVMEYGVWLGCWKIDMETGELVPA